jgi:hypothetical protein
MAFKLTNEQMKMLVQTQTAPPSTGDLMLWGKVDRKESKADRKREKVNKEGGLRDKYDAAMAAGKTRKAARIKKRMERKLRKAKDKEKDAYDTKRRPDYWMRRDETL